MIDDPIGARLARQRYVDDSNVYCERTHSRQLNSQRVDFTVNFISKHQPPQLITVLFAACLDACKIHSNTKHKPKSNANNH